MNLCGIVILGLNAWDLAIIVLFLAAILTVGIVVSRSVQHEGDFYLGGRKFGKWLQFFLNFGNSTDSTGAVSTSREVYRVGAGGIWFGFQTLFITPFFWFTQPWFRRVRLVTMADLFVDRFNSRGLASAYAGFNILIALITLASGNIAVYSVSAAMIQKPIEAYTTAERQETADYREYGELKSRRVLGVLPDDAAKRFQYLDEINGRQPLRPTIPYFPKVPFLIGYSLAVALYITLGGLKAAAITDAIQGILILLMSVLLIPIGLYYLGGFSALHAAVPSFKFKIVGDPAVSDYTWYSILAITFTSLIQILGLMHNMSMGGSARNEDTARFGMITGGFSKRFVIIAWTLCALIAVAVFAGPNSVEPDAAWGALSRKLLPPGLMGLMLSGMLLGHMPAVGVASVSVSALALRNLYEPLVRGKSAKHYMRFGQAAIGVILGLGVLCALVFRDVRQAYTMMITFNTFFGAVVFLIIFWRRLTPHAIAVGLVLWVMVMGIVPWVLPQMNWFSEQPALLATTSLRHVIAKAPANDEDVAAGKAARKGDLIEKPQDLLPTPLFFDGIGRSDPADFTSARIGSGRFNVEAYTLHLLGVPVENFNSAGRLATQWALDGLLPFVMLVAFSLITPSSEPKLAVRFYAKLKTPIAPTAEEDLEEVNKSIENPNRFDHRKLFPRTQWEFSKWRGKDFVGFFGCWAIVGSILFLLWAVLNIGA